MGSGHLGEEKIWENVKGGENGTFWDGDSQMCKWNHIVGNGNYEVEFRRVDIDLGF